eukprot:TRINITY_DN2992_c1_g1_i1.p1 TRINITY_DN2992_c1_g1~~TRINITY_DN2992_c1_g1_i1.p1  ORF type:complete len:109 (+),score=18.82 TRINITY_DN2992_c1_g1_i1:108-434(+)
MDECAAKPCGGGQACVDQNSSISLDFICSCIGSSGNAVGKPADCSSGSTMESWVAAMLAISGSILFLSCLIVVAFCIFEYRDHRGIRASVEAGDTGSRGTNDEGLEMT